LLAVKNTADVGGKPIAILLQYISEVSAINPLVAFYDIHGGKREVLFFYFVPDTTQAYDDYDGFKTTNEVKIPKLHLLFGIKYTIPQTWYKDTGVSSFTVRVSLVEVLSVVPLASLHRLSSIGLHRHANLSPGTFTTHSNATSSPTGAATD
jgi:hypothetical protein